MKNYFIENGLLITYNGKSAKPLIPKDVTEIAAWAFSDCDNLTSIKIPSNVQKIGDFAFSGCRNLTSINMPNSVTEIGWGAFLNCYSLTSIEIPNSVRQIGENAFDNCKNLASIKIPNSVTHIWRDAFDGIKEVKRQYNANGSLRAFKAFFNNWTCRGFHYEIGKSYHQDGKIACCLNGFHACPHPLYIFGYYYGNLKSLHFAEVELSGEMDDEIDKVAASDIRIIRELTISELADIYNSMEKC